MSRELTKLQEEYPELKIKKIDILAHPGKALKDGVRMIPTLQAGDRKLTGIFLSPAQIRAFVSTILTDRQPEE